MVKRGGCHPVRSGKIVDLNQQNLNPEEEFTGDLNTIRTVNANAEMSEISRLESTHP